MLHHLRSAAKHRGPHAGRRAGALATLLALDDDPVLLCDCPHGSCSAAPPARPTAKGR